LDPAACQRAANIFRALGDPMRLQMLALLLERERCVTEITEALGDNISAVSQRLRLLRAEAIVVHRREGKHVFYALADHHVAQLISNGLAHARETGEARPTLTTVGSSEKA
jgi:ArsR family transcriptional regulator